MKFNNIISHKNSFFKEIIYLKINIYIKIWYFMKINFFFLLWSIVKIRFLSHDWLAKFRIFFFFSDHLSKFAMYFRNRCDSTIFWQNSICIFVSFWWNLGIFFPDSFPIFVLYFIFLLLAIVSQKFLVFFFFKDCLTKFTVNCGNSPSFLQSFHSFL